MHHNEFDALSRLFARGASRRGAMTGFFGCLLAAVPWSANGGNAEAGKRNKKRKRRRRKKSRPGPNPLPPPVPPCAHICATAKCGDDGCGGSCGVCTGGQTCQSGNCACPEDICAGECVAACPAGSQRESDSCDCCLSSGTTCTSATSASCCSATCDFLIDPPGGVCAPCRGRTCDATRPCCDGLPCTGGYCDGCRDRATSCTSPSQCCFSDCTGACLSNMGGRCARDVDCRACYLDVLKCPGACVNGSCTV